MFHSLCFFIVTLPSCDAGWGRGGAVLGLLLDVGSHKADVSLAICAVFKLPDS